MRQCVGFRYFFRDLLRLFIAKRLNLTQQIDHYGFGQDLDFEEWVQRASGYLKSIEVRY